MSARLSVVKGDFSNEYLDWRKLRNELETSGGDPYGVIVRLDGVIKHRAWEQLTDKKGNAFSSFSQFVRDPDKGLGMATDELLKLVDVQGETERRALVSKDVERVELFTRVRDLVRRAIKDDLPETGRHGGDRSKKGNHSCYPNPNMNADGMLSRLKRDRPELAQQVIEGELTATRAAQIAGFRTPVVRLGKPATVAAKLRDHYSREDLAELARLICE
ncbi:hypothetical protein [Corynebacterium marquesiae]|uniref:hypothetical protein n=1 Tax=Corynebacterium marquesiae TaxID=2913503 RepID=UPI0032EAD761